MNVRLRGLIAGTVVVAGLAPRGALAADWEQWRGPERDGISRETGLLKQWPAEGPELAWRADKLGAGYSTPAVAGDRLFLLGSEGLEKEFVHALNLSDGEKIWTQQLGKVGNPDQRPPYPGARSTPTVDGDQLFALSSDGDLVSLAVADGEVKWRKNLRTDFGGQPGEWAYSESPLVDGEVLVCTPGGSDATLVALNKNTGEVIWKASLDSGEEAGYASVVAAEIAGVKQYVQFLQKGLVGVDAKTGRMLWRYDHTATGSMANIPTPVVQGDTIYSASGRGGGGLVKITRNGNEFSADEVYFEGNLPKAIGGTVLVDDHLYGTNSEALMCVELASGEVKWRERGIGAASVCYADGMLYLHGEEGEVALVEATPEAYREKGRFTPVDAPDRGKSKAWAYPVIAEGRLYIFDAGTLWCYNVK